MRKRLKSPKEEERSFEGRECSFVEEKAGTPISLPS
jgi:hypothetical protein